MRIKTTVLIKHNGRVSGRTIEPAGVGPLATGDEKFQPLEAALADAVERVQPRGSLSALNTLLRAAAIQARRTAYGTVLPEQHEYTKQLLGEISADSASKVSRPRKAEKTTRSRLTAKKAPRLGRAQ